MPDPDSLDPQPAASHLRIHSMMVPVTNLDRSLAFYVGSLDFRFVATMTFPHGTRGGVVAPPDGTSVLVLVEADPEKRMGTTMGISFVTDDIEGRYREWLARDVRFTNAPRSVLQAARHTIFFDPDDNGFGLVEADAITGEIEAERRSIADRLEAERRATHELEIATQVQAGLFPQRHPLIQTLDYAGICLQARQVGGDYFDFLDPGGGRLGIVVGDVSGKGIGAALLMANLQANIRSHYARHAEDLSALLSLVNQSFFESTPQASYATLFLATYDGTTRQLQFINCGHPGPLLLRTHGGTEPLEATSPALGMFERWTGTCATVQLVEGDVLAIYTDGVSEALSESDEEFGTTRLVDVLQASSRLGAQQQLDQAVASIQQFSRGTQYDDITLLIARCVGR